MRWGTELNGVQSVFAGLTADEWKLPTKLVPFNPDQPHWTVFELAGHFDISIGLTRMLVSSLEDGQPGGDRTSFFIFPRSEVAPVVYDYAYTMVEGKTPANMPGVLQHTFSKTIEEARARPPRSDGSGYYALMELGEFVPSRIVEAVVHGLVLTNAGDGPQSPLLLESPRPPPFSMSCWPAEPSRAGPLTSKTTWNGSRQPPAEPSILIPGCH